MNTCKRKVTPLRASQGLSETFPCTGYKASSLEGEALRGSRVARIGISAHTTTTNNNDDNNDYNSNDDDDIIVIDNMYNIDSIDITNTSIDNNNNDKHKYSYVCMYIYIYIYVHMCIYIHICICIIYIHTYTHTYQQCPYTHVTLVIVARMYIKTTVQERTMSEIIS